MEIYKNILKTILILGVSLLIGCSSDTGKKSDMLALFPTINNEKIDFNFIHDVDSKNDTISYTLKNNENIIVLSLPEGASIHTWIISDKTIGMKLINQERIIIKDKKDTEGESPYRQEFTFEMEDSDSKNIVMKKVNLLDLENVEEHNYTQVEPIFELSIQIIQN